jgi:hypothetical protein
MTKDYSPFTPGQPVPVEYFVGRVEETAQLRRRVQQAAAGSLQAVFLTGERGIGKSSLAAAVRQVAETQDRMLGVHAYLGGVSSLPDMASRILDKLVKESVDQSWFATIKEFLGGRVRQVGLFGVTFELAVGPEDLRSLVAGFVPALRDLARRLQGQKQGLLLVLDDVNGLAESADFAHWLKSTVDEIATGRDRLPLCIVLVGLEQRRRSLIDLQPSLARVFTLIELRPWSPGETRGFFERAFAKVNVPVDPPALEIMSRYAGGHPVLAHEIGDAVFHADTDNRIVSQDALNGVVAAADIVGRKHLEPAVFAAIRSAKYRAILRTLAQRGMQPSFRRAELMAQLEEGEARVLDNFLHKMKELGVVHEDAEGGRGSYRFANELHLLYFWMEAERAQRAPQ